MAPRVVTVMKGDWPSVGEMRQWNNHAVRMTCVTVNEASDVITLELEYGCTHKKLSNVSRWACVEMACAYYVGKWKADTTPSGEAIVGRPRPPDFDVFDAAMTRGQEYILEEELDRER